MERPIIRIPSLRELQMHRSEKWRAFESDVLPLPVAEMDFEVAQPIRDVMFEMVNRSDLGYLGPIPEAGRAFAGFAQRRWGWQVDPTEVHLATDVGVAAVEVLRVATRRGDKVLINSPIYQNFYNWLKESGVEKVDVPFIYKPGGDEIPWSIDWDGVEKAYASGISVHMICNPHNPLGRLYSESDLDRFVELAKKHKVLIISDEIHAPLTLKPYTFHPFLSRPGADEVGITITAASKAWNIAGTKAALIITHSEKLHALIKSMPLAVHYRASILGGFALVAAFERGEPWLDAAIEKLDENRKILKNLLDSKIPAIKYAMPQMSYLAWLDCTALGMSEEPAKLFLEKGRVAFNAGAQYGPQAKEFVRFNFATSEEIISAAVDRMVRTLSAL